MARRLALVATAAACLCVPATASAEPPVNDDPRGAQAITPEFTGFFVVPASRVAGGGVESGDWPEASVNDVDDAAPTCLGHQGYKSLWYKVTVPEASVLRVTVTSTDVDRFQPVVTIHAPSTPEAPGPGEELGCGLGGTNSSDDPSAVTSAYAFRGDFLIRVAQAVSNFPNAGGPQVTISIVARDVAPPKITITTRSATASPGMPKNYQANVVDGGAGVNRESAKWLFCDPDPATCIEGPVPAAGEDALASSHRWKRSGPRLRKVVFEVRDRAQNISTYSWVVYVRDEVRPVVSFATTLPAPGARRMRITIDHDEYVKVKLQVTQQRASGVPRSLFKQTLTLHESPRKARRTIILRPFVGTGSLIITGIARDRTGNATLLPTCVVDPVLGTGACFGA